ncbi:MAG: ADP compounds hydrolase NudE [Pseudomonadota bacterium]
MKKPPVILHQEIIAETRLFKVEALHLRFSNGEERRYERLKAGRYGAVMIVPMQDEDTVLLTKEYAAGLDHYELGLPKGLVEKDESFIEAANRELMEEVGYGAHELVELKSISLAPGYLNHRMSVVLARDLYPKRLQGDEPEEIEVVPWKLSELPELFKQANCTEARSIAALYLARDYLENGYTFNTSPPQSD